ncbi:unnamed protein product (macronuclear) [Paramecium tetraurelia]|uniref:Uncharacterized protein n=1 Tax=Paramecium tetraurelia TaxID=5888 RepID=A0CHS9_PARTE|nr:uncharacterized protein GSPATT00038448001 [Paramecium tetraurelia]CAK70346.1 unnamed protein product [Paramecium tetraurelia]|eukprot:XP_001437743.1 hypothetical protein (macronuclear) [Paramecium tetraurelia strain d4-2]
MIINNYLLINHDLDVITSQRPPTVVIEDQFKCLNNTNFSRTFRKTQLLRKLDTKQNNTNMMSSTKLKPITTSQSLICLSLKTPIYEAKEKKLELANLKMGKRMKRQTACQTDCFDNNIYFRKTLSSNFQQPGKAFFYATLQKSKIDFYKVDGQTKQK